MIRSIQLWFWSQVMKLLYWDRHAVDKLKRAIDETMKENRDATSEKKRILAEWQADQKSEKRRIE